MLKFLRDPLTHFLAAGLLIFLLFELVSSNTPDDTDSDVIKVDRDSVLTFVQYRSRLFDPDRAAETLAGMPSDVRELLLQDFVREEALYREALALGLDANDYIIKQRLIQKIEFIAEGFAESSFKPDEVDLEAHYQANRDQYYVTPDITFAHVFFSNERRGATEAAALAATKIEELNRENVPFSDAPGHGDRFLYHINYVERTPDYVTSHFGPEMATSLFEGPVESKWQGPFMSAYGSHLVMVTSRHDGRYPDFAEVRERVLDDARRAQIREQKESMIAEIVASYDVRPDPEFETLVDR